MKTSAWDSLYTMIQSLLLYKKTMMMTVISSNFRRRGKQRRKKSKQKHSSRVEGLQEQMNQKVTSSQMI